MYNIINVRAVCLCLYDVHTQTEKYAEDEEGWSGHGATGLYVVYVCATLR